MTTDRTGLLPEASPRLKAYLERHGVVRDRSRQSVDRIHEALSSRGRHPPEWAGLLALEESWGGLMLAPWPGPPAMRLGAALPLFLEESWREEDRGGSELPVSQAPPWPRMRCLGYKLWLCGTTSQLVGAHADAHEPAHADTPASNDMPDTTTTTTASPTKVARVVAIVMAAGAN